MRKPVFILALPLATLLATSQFAGALDLFGWKPFSKDKKTEAKTASNREEAAAQEELKKGTALETSGKTDAAAKIFRQIVKNYELTTAASKAQFH
ncbi:MAG: hypothetical protein ABL994_19670, partial [Verrucomicrobiales bacterium]